MDATLQLVEELREEAAQGRITSGADVSSRCGERPQRTWRRAARIRAEHTPTVILVVGVNGSGKTTTVAKLAAYCLSQLGQSVVSAGRHRSAPPPSTSSSLGRARRRPSCARARAPTPGAVAYDTVASAKARGADVALIDTAGRLQTQHNLMEEPDKSPPSSARSTRPRPTRCSSSSTPPPARTACSQARLFDQAADLSGVVLTKLDGTAKGGIAMAIRRELGVPVKLVGSGEKWTTSSPFDARGLRPVRSSARTRPSVAGPQARGAAPAL